MKLLNKREFANGCVYAFTLADGMPIEVTDTFLPFYTKDASFQNTNELRDCNLGSRSERWMIGVSTMSGCPIRCKFCATGKLKKWRNLTDKEIVLQVSSMINVDDGGNPCERIPLLSKEFKINYTRMGEPFLNLENVKKAINYISEIYPNTHHYISTIGLKGSDFSWIEGNISLQISLHALSDERRKELIPVNNLMTLEELGKIRTKSNLKTTLNLTLVDEKDFDIEILKKYFDPEFFFIKLSPINVNEVSDANGLGKGIVAQTNLL